MIELLLQLGITNVNELNDKLQCDQLHNISPAFSKYILVYAKNQKGIKDIYKLISNSSTVNLYHNIPRLMNSLLMNNRENLIIANAPCSSDIFE
jgi:DNA polymerase-3 subunit alpha (Gram-positive type)